MTLTTGEQPMLFDVEAFEAATSKERWCHNARWTKVRDPQKYDMIVRMLADRETISSISRTLECSRNLVAWIKENEPALEQLRPRWEETAKEIRAVGLRRLRDEIHEMPIDQVPWTVKVVHEMETISAGGVTQRIEHTRPATPLEDWLNQGAQFRDVTPPPMGLEAEKMPALPEPPTIDLAPIPTTPRAEQSPD